MPTVKPASVPPKRLSATINASSTGFKTNNILDWDGETDLTSDRFGTLAYGAFMNPTRTRLEIFSFDPATIGNATIDFVTRGLDYNGDLTEVAANKQTWLGKQTIVLLGTDVPSLLAHYVTNVGDQTIEGVKTFASSPKVPLTPSEADDAASKSYADNAALAAGGITAFQVTQNGALTVDVGSGRWMKNDVVQTYAGASAQAVTNGATNYVQLRFDGTLVINTTGFLQGHLPCGEVTASGGAITSIVDRRAWLTLATDQLSNAFTYGATISALDPLYVDSAASNKLKKALATGSSTADVVAVALDAGVDTNTNKRVYLPGSVITGLSGLTANARVYLTDAGGFSGTPGTFRKTVGWALSTTSMLFLPIQAIEAQAGANSATTTANLQEVMTLINATDVTGAELETLSSSESSNADSLHRHAVAHVITQLSSQGNVTGLDRLRVGYSDDTEKRFCVSSIPTRSSGTPEVDTHEYILVNGRTLVLDAIELAINDPATQLNGTVLIGTSEWLCGSSEIKKDGSAVTISGTARYGDLGYDAGSSHLLIQYSTTKIARFSGVAGTTITNANADITLDTAVDQKGFVWEDTNNMIYCLDTTANIVRKFNSSGVSQGTYSYGTGIDDTNFIGLCVIAKTVHIVKYDFISLGNSAGYSVIISLIPTTFTF